MCLFLFTNTAKIQWIFNNIKYLKIYYKILLFRVYFIFLLKNKNKQFIIKKKKKNLSFHQFDSFSYLYFNIIKYKKLIKFSKKNNNKSMLGHKVNYNKIPKSYKLTNTYLYNKNLFATIVYNVVSINLNIYNYKIHILVCNNLGYIYFIPYMQNVNLFKFYFNTTSKVYNMLDLKLPYLYSYIYKLKLSTIIFNISQPNKNNTYISKTMYCRSLGSVAKLIAHNYVKLLSHIILPSKKKIYINSLHTSFIYYTPIFKVEESRKIPKASIKHKLGYKPHVRGIAKNAVDHPHGGNTNIIKVKKNPWGVHI